MTRDRVEVLIVGAGPTGLALAAQLRRFEVRPRVIDRQPTRVHESRAEAVACRLRHADGRTERIEASYLVGCDGAHSTVRHGAGIAFEGGAYPQAFARLGVNEVAQYLVRPDGHVAYRAGGNDLTRMARYLARWLIGEP